MFPSWRIELGEARRALKAGQLDRACAIVDQESLREFRQARELSCELAGRVASRAESRMAMGQSSAGWHDLELADRMAGSDQATAPLRTAYQRRVITRIVRALGEGHTARAKQDIAKLRERRLDDATVRHLEQLANRLDEAEQMLSAGKSAEALQTLAELRSNTAGASDTIDLSNVDRRVEHLTSRSERHVQLSGQLLDASAAKDWHQVLSLADAMLAVAARDRVARAARRRAWHAVGLDATQVYHGSPRGHAALAVASPSGPAHDPRFDPSSSMTDSPAPQRFMMWIDAVGGYLVCLDDEVTLGQPAPGAPVAVPLCADLSRRHAVIRREQGSYTIEPVGEVTVDGRRLTGPMVLGDRHEIGLGDVVRLEFRRPHALSATARLVPLSGHRTEPRADAVLLMADSCVLGPKQHSHVVCRHLSGDLMLFRQDGRLYCRTPLDLTIDGQRLGDRAPLDSGARLEGEEFGMSLEDA